MKGVTSYVQRIFYVQFYHGGFIGRTQASIDCIGISTATQNLHEEVWIRFHQQPSPLILCLQKQGIRRTLAIQCTGFHKESILLLIKNTFHFLS
jgi:hypothetical protein